MNLQICCKDTLYFALLQGKGNNFHLRSQIVKSIALSFVIGK